VDGGPQLLALTLPFQNQYELAIALCFVHPVALPLLYKLNRNELHYDLAFEYGSNS
jgi:hypothetical protein